MGERVCLNGKGDEVSGGGKGTPFMSPLTLRFNGGSNKAPLSFLRFLPLISEEFAGKPCAAAAAACLTFISCSSNVCENFSSTDQKKPFPLSPPHRSIFKNARPDDRL